MRMEFGAAYRADGLCHARHAHDDGQSSPTEGSDGELVVDVAQFSLGGQNAHVIKFCEELAFHARAEGVLGRESCEAVGIAAELTTKLIISGPE